MLVAPCDDPENQVVVLDGSRTPSDGNGTGWIVEEELLK
jgi:hypothetical protein